MYESDFSSFHTKELSRIMNLTCFIKQVHLMTDFLFLECGDNPVNTVKVMIQLLPSIMIIIIVGSTLP